MYIRQVQWRINAKAFKDIAGLGIWFSGHGCMDIGQTLSFLQFRIGNG
jgi:hypothetical protein